MQTDDDAARGEGANLSEVLGVVLDAFAPSDPKCPVCEKKSWGTWDGFAAVQGYKGADIPCVLRFCNHCGFVRLHNKAVLEAHTVLRN